MKVKNFSKLKIVLFAIFLISLCFSIFKITDTLAGKVELKLSKAEVAEKSDDVAVAINGINDNDVDINSTFHKVGSFVRYKLTFKNTVNEDLTIKSISHSNPNPYLDYEYDTSEGTLIKANESFEFYFKAIYKNEVTDMTKRDSQEKFKLTITFEDQNGNESSSDIIINPNTSDNIVIYLIIGGVSLAALFLIFIKNKTSKKIICLLLVLTPFVAKALTTSITITFNADVKLHDKVAVTTIVGGNKVTNYIPYSDKFSEPSVLPKAGYEVLGWFKGDKKFDFSSDVLDDTELTLKYKPITYNITYELDGGILNNATATYNVETETFSIGKPSKVGFVFAGWTGSNGTSYQTDVDITKGSTGDKNFVAHFEVGTETPYKVVHKYQKLNGGYDVDEQNLKGVTNSTVTPALKSKVGFVNPSLDNLFIKPDGSSELVYEYSREEYSLTVNSDVETSFINPTYPFETLVTVKAKDKEGYTFTNWSNGKTTNPLSFKLIENTSITPVYSANNYTISYHANNGTTSTLVDTFVYDEVKNLRNNSFSNQGYSFVSWNTKADGTGDSYNENELVLNLATSGNVDLYAIWTPNSNIVYTVIHRYELLNGSYDEVAIADVGTTNDTVTPSVVNRTGYDAPTPETITISPDGGSILTYTYTLKVLELTVSSDVETLFTEPTYKYGTEITVNAKNKDGYTFSKWNNDVTNSTYVFNITTNTNLYPLYDANNYTVTFNSNNGLNETNIQTFTYDQADNLDSNGFIYTGHTFNGWNTEIDGSGDSYLNEAEVINLATSGNINLYAMWTLDSYTVTFDPNNGENTTEVIKNYDEEIGTFPEVTYDGFNLLGWFTDSTNGDEVFTTTKVTGVVTYYAHWEEIKPLCKKATTIHSQVCSRTDGKGCTAAGYAVGDEIFYGNIPYNYTSGDAYTCDVNGDGIYNEATERFYYLRTLNNKAVLIYSANFGDSGSIDNANIFVYSDARTYLPTSSIWGNVPEISDGVITRFTTRDDLFAACPNCNQTTEYSLADCIYILENTGFVTSDKTKGRSAIWMEPIFNQENETRYRYRGDTVNVVTIPAADIDTSKNGVRPVIEVPLQLMDKRKTIYFDPNNGVDEPIYRYVNDGSSLSTLPTASKEHGILDGWYTEAVGGTKISEQTIPLNDATYYAHYLYDISHINLASDVIFLHAGDTDHIQVLNKNELYETYTFASLDDSIATVNEDGVVTGVNIGTTNVVITGNQSGETKVVTIRVIDDNTNITVYLNTNGGDPLDPLSIPAGFSIGTLPTPTKNGSNFDAWYQDPELTILATEDLVINVETTLYAKWYSPDDIARINHKYYADLPSAFDNVPANQKTEIVILKDFSFDEQITITDNKIVDFNLDNHTYTFTATTASSVFNVNQGELYLSSGTITSGAGNGMIDIGTNGKLYITGGTYIKTGQKQVVYNNGGTLTISGDPVLKTQITAATNERAVVHNLKSGKTYIYGGTIISDGVATASSCKSSVAVCNESGTVEIGVKGGTVTDQTPVLQANAYGVVTNSGQKTYFYDGIIKGYTKTFNNNPTTEYLEPGTSIVNGTETINSKIYKTATLGFTDYHITLNPSDGEVSPTSLTITPGNALQSLPTPTRDHYQFDGWYDEDDNLVTNETIPDGSHEYHAKWTYVVSDEIVSFRTTNEPMKVYYAKIDTWKNDSSNFPTWNSSNKQSNGWALDNVEQPVMKTNFDNFNCECTTDDVQCYSSGTELCDKPKGYHTGFNEKVNVYLSDEATKTKGELVSYAKSNYGVIYNLIPNQVYMWELDSDPSIYGYIKFTGERRILETGDIRNSRDLGGLPVDTDSNGTIDGHLKYGRLFRGIKLKSASSVTELVNLGVTSELDLRSASDSDVNKLSDSVGKIFKQIEAQNYYVNPNSTNATERTYYSWTRAGVKYAMQQIVAGENLYFHCRIGTDRTGTIAYVLEGLLGVPEEERIRDYELSFFYGLIRIHRYHNEKPGSSVGTGKERFVYMHDLMPTNSDIYNWYMAGSDNVAEDNQLITDFRNAMIENN